MTIQEIQRKFVCGYGAALEIQRLRESLEFCAKVTGNPDPAQGCRLAQQIVVETLHFT